MISRNKSANSSKVEPIRYSRFIIPKKEGTVRFITDYHKLNQQLVIKPYPIPRICENM